MMKTQDHVLFLAKQLDRGSRASGFLRILYFKRQYLRLFETRTKLSLPLFFLTFPALIRCDIIIMS